MAAKERKGRKIGHFFCVLCVPLRLFRWFCKRLARCNAFQRIPRHVLMNYELRGMYENSTLMKSCVLFIVTIPKTFRVFRS